MFSVVVMPLSEFLAGDDDDFELGAELLSQFQETLSEELGTPVSWSEEAGQEGFEVEPVDLDLRELFALRVAAAYFEEHGDLKGCDPGEEPWRHPVFERLEKEDGSKKFPQILHAFSDAVCYAPVDLPDVFFLSPVDDEDEGEEGETAPGAEGEEAEDDDDASSEEVGVGSLPALIEELELLREPLGLPERVEDIEVEQFVTNPDSPLSVVKYTWYHMRDRAREATSAKLPMLVVWNEFDEDDEDGEEDEDTGG